MCPACDQPLLNADDVVLANLNPTDDYKTSILSGLSPNTIMECAGRALNFWAYQTSQEMWVLLDFCTLSLALLTLSRLYQGMQAKALADRYTKLKGQMDSIIREANEEMSIMRENLNSKQGFLRSSHSVLIVAQARSENAISSSIRTRTFKERLLRKPRIMPEPRSSMTRPEAAVKWNTLSKQQKAQQIVQSRLLQHQTAMLTISATFPMTKTNQAGDIRCRACRCNNHQCRI